MIDRPFYRLSVAVAAAILIALSIDLVSSTFAVGAQHSGAELAATLEFVARASIHSVVESARAIAGLLTAAAVILMAVRWLNRRDQSRTARRPVSPP
jgi:hypothetical protein